MLPTEVENNYVIIIKSSHNSMIDLKKIFLKGLLPRSQGMVSLVAGWLKWDTDIGYHISTKHWIDCIIKNKNSSYALMHQLWLECFICPLPGLWLVNRHNSLQLIGQTCHIFSRLICFIKMWKFDFLQDKYQYSTTPPQSKKLHKSYIIM